VLERYLSPNHSLVSLGLPPSLLDRAPGESNETFQFPPSLLSDHPFGRGSRAHPGASENSFSRKKGGGFGEGKTGTKDTFFTGKERERPFSSAA